MKRIALVALGIAALVVATGAEKGVNTGVIGRTENLPYNEYKNIKPLLRVALLREGLEEFEPKLILRVSRSTVPALIQEIAPGYEGPDLEEVYTVIFTAKGRRGRVYSADVAVTKAGNVLLWNPPKLIIWHPTLC